MATQNTSVLKRFGPHVEDMRVALNELAPDIAYKLGNMQWLDEMKAGIRYRNGETLSALTERMFLVAALVELATTRNHSGVLAKNMEAAGDSKPVGEVESHHIVAWRAAKARQSRLLLFAWRIAINDKDNGVHLPAYKGSQVASLPDAVKHRTIHSDIYHAQVFLRLRAAAIQNGDQTEAGREALRAIKKRILDGTFPYRPEHLA